MVKTTEYLKKLPAYKKKIQISRVNVLEIRENTNAKFSDHCFVIFTNVYGRFLALYYTFKLSMENHRMYIISSLMFLCNYQNANLCITYI